MTDSKLPYVRFFMSDWLGATRGMKAAEIGTYFTLLALMYERGEPLQEDSRRLARQCGCTVGAFEGYLSMLIEEGKIIRMDDGLWNNRVTKEFEWRAENSKQSSEAAQNRWQKHNKNNGRSVRAHSERNADAMPIPEARNQKEKRETNVSPKKSGSRLPIDWFPSQPDIDFAKQEGLSEHSINTEAAKFRDYWHAKTGQGASKLDWSATWRNWVRNAPKRHPSTSQAKQPSTLDGLKDAIMRAKEQERGHANSGTDRPPFGELRVISG